MINTVNYLNLVNPKTKGWPILSLKEDDDSRLSQFIYEKLLPEFVVSGEEHFRIGIVYNFAGHTTPIVVDIKVSNQYDELELFSEDRVTSNDPFLPLSALSHAADSAASFRPSPGLSEDSNGSSTGTEEELNYYDDDDFHELSYQSLSIKIYNTDSRSFDVENGAALKAQLISLVTTSFDKGIDLHLIANGLIVTDDSNNKNTTRQTVNGYCGLYSLVDLETLLAQPDLDVFVSNTVPVSEEQINYLGIDEAFTACFNGDTCLHQLCALPAEMMLYTQSVKGDEDSHRRGLTFFSQHSVSAGSIKLSKSTAGAAAEPLKFFREDTSSKAQLLTRYLSSHYSKTESREIDIKSLLVFICANNITHNFVLDAINEMYEERVGDFDIDKKDDFDAVSMSPKKLQQLIKKSTFQIKQKSSLESDADEEENISRRPDSPLTIFYQSTSSRA